MGTKDGNRKKVLRAKEVSLWTTIGGLIVLILEIALSGGKTW